MKNKDLPTTEDLFDDQIRKTLDNVSVPYNVQHWEMMREKLETLNAHDTQFDASVQKNVTAIQPILNPEHWSAFAEKLDAENKNEAHFDDAVAASLKNTEPRFNPEHWQKMSKVLDDNFTWYGKIVRYKVIELGVLLFAVLTAINIMQNYFVPMPMYHQRRPDLKQYVPVHKDRTTIFAVTSPNNFDNNFLREGNDEVSENSKIENIKINLAPYGISGNTEVVSVSQTGSVESKNSISPIPAINVSKTGGTTFIFSENLNNNNDGLLTVEIKKLQTDISSVNETNVLPVSPVNTLNAEVIALNNFSENVTPVLLTPSDKKANRGWYAGLQLSGNADFVNTSFFSNNNELPISEIAYSVSTGATFSYKKNKTEYEGGISYGSKSYAPPQVSLTTGSFATGYIYDKPKELELRLLSASLGVRQTLWQKKHLSLFARLGTTFHTAVSVIDKRDTKTTNVLAAVNLIQRSADQIPVYENTGKKNFVTADMSLGVHYKINSKWAAYLQSSYRHHLSYNGIGSLNDHLNSLALDVGIKIKL